ncbi:hypothetical protein B0J12DRAFT_606517 [Macrophomina phaseolina]|uniref:Uncharacterized protein n=1 Tax=Macrophomina phaseolina TaxID=35725 RepID=A0ABQ8G028_9PEZI|nr:hypothetical protein B0J12DRAFT_606517 [Macrophomina phaseolina]
MVLGIITAVAACPGIIGTTEAVRQGQRQNAKEKHRGLKTNLVVSCSGTQDGSQEVHGRSVVLHNNKLYINTPSLPKSTIKPHPFAGYFLPHPSHSWRRLGEGLVSTISDEPPQLNWIYVDTNTHEVKYGYRVDCEGQLVGPWNVTPVGKRLTLEGWEGFIALEEIRGSGIWEVAFDRDADGLMEEEHKEVEVEYEIVDEDEKKGAGEASDGGIE